MSIHPFKFHLLWWKRLQCLFPSSSSFSSSPLSCLLPPLLFLFLSFRAGFRLLTLHVWLHTHTLFNVPQMEMLFLWQPNRKIIIIHVSFLVFFRLKQFDLWQKLTPIIICLVDLASPGLVWRHFPVILPLIWLSCAPSDFDSWSKVKNWWFDDVIQFVVVYWMLPKQFRVLGHQTNFNGRQE